MKGIRMSDFTFFRRYYRQNNLECWSAYWTNEAGAITTDAVVINFEEKAISIYVLSNEQTHLEDNNFLSSVEGLAHDLQTEDVEYFIYLRKTDLQDDLYPSEYFELLGIKFEKEQYSFT